MDDVPAPARGATSELRRQRVRLAISREASRLFWEQGVAATTGAQIAAAAGLSTRTVWRHFRSKESCAEPIVERGVRREMSLLRSWPSHLSLEEHLTAELREYERGATPTDRVDDALAIRMAVLATTEPALRTAWLMACDQEQRSLADRIALRARVPADDLRVRLDAAGAAAVVRALTEAAATALLSGTGPGELAGTPSRPVP
ncbi:TetR/AcrR family transcriptional regulator [Streptomyces sp. NPDC057245]|uniref:TetR/AcrR family transcriptional regulator n=1 Tax=Streptomyces TaxID=1883 RepID=UPI001C1DDC39|nr:TetR/AcrR family transcriptional regulator [Streptomyces sp. A108]MBU6536459.1 TetR/AcrR family transcriptional regulator [Streptomyces sp. A108]